MPLFIVRRDLPPVQEDELRAALVRSVTCTYEFNGMKWLRTFWDEDASRAYCVYEAESIAQLRQHAELSRIPCTDVWPVLEIDPQTLESPSEASAV